MSDDKKVSVEDIPKFIERLIDAEAANEYESLRLNNIINELEKMLEEGMNYSDYYEGDLSDIYEEIYDYLQELKENK